MPSTRRDHLYRFGTSALGVALAGCTTVAPPLADDGETTVTITSVTSPSGLPIRPDVEVTRSLATEEDPPQLRTTLTNTTENPVVIGDIRNAHFENTFDESSEYVLIPDDSGYGNADSGCWRITGGVGHAATYQTVKIPPDEPSSRLVNLFAHGEGENCLPTGTYSFSTLMNVSKKTGEGTQGVSWGFEIRII